MYSRAAAVVALLLAVLVCGGQALAAQSITVTAPSSGDELTVGQVFNITWTTQELTDCRIDFSPDNGATWETITDSVDDTKTEWLDYPWTPTKACTQCLIKVSGYEREVPTESGVFAIKAADDGGDDGGGCSVSGTPQASLAALLLLGLIVGLRRRRR